MPLLPTSLGDHPELTPDHLYVAQPDALLRRSHSTRAMLESDGNGGQQVTVNGRCTGCGCGFSKTVPVPAEKKP